MSEYKRKQEEASFCMEYNRTWSKLLHMEREKQNISQAKLASGIAGRHTLLDMEKGIVGWSKTIGDLLMHRLGISTEYFEIVTTESEMIRWKYREQVCANIFAHPELADEGIRRLEKEKKENNRAELQFLEKVKVIRRIAEGENPENAMVQAKKAVNDTITENWEKGLEGLLLAPAELETILLVSYLYYLMGDYENAFRYQQEVWKYPKQRGWEERMQELIVPAAAIAGIAICKSRGMEAFGFQMGREAYELLRRMISQRYLYPLLCAMETLRPESGRDNELLKQMLPVRRCLDSLYLEFGIPKLRIWQTITFENTCSSKDILHRLRIASGKSKENAVAGSDMQDIISPRQLARIESGRSNVSEGNYRKLVKQYGKAEALKMTLILTDSLEALQLRQEISNCIYMHNWEEAQKKMEELEKMIDINHPKNCQQFLFWKGVLGYNSGKLSHEECIHMLQNALVSTIPDFDKINKVCWMYQRQEMLIINSIAAVYRRTGNYPDARKWCDSIYRVQQKRMDKYGNYNSCYPVIARNYANIVGDSGLHREAIRLDGEEIKKLLQGTKINCIGNLLYDRAWNAYEAVQKGMEAVHIMKKQWMDDFRRSIVILDLVKDKAAVSILKQREDKYLHSNI